jgi:hypothetical protein
MKPTLSVFQKNNKYCQAQGRDCDFREKKQTDVALAVTALEDAMDGVIDRAICAARTDGVMLRLRDNHRKEEL